jgi:alginate O-acetyltransferase complex protein AlgI
MILSSVVFLLYFLPAFLFTYYLVGNRHKNLVILAFSIFFYAWGAPKFIFVILATTFVDFHIVKWMYRSSSATQRKSLLTLSIFINVGLLVYFKYSNFFIENLNWLFSLGGGPTIKWAKLLLPIGISFYTFETVTYVVDVYRGVHKPLNKFWDYQTYIILFPKLIAGPIVRYHELADQITDRSQNDTIDNRLTGFYRFVIGLAKKVIIANHIGQQADAIFAMDYHTLNSYSAWIGILAYTFQIYFDFSGYSDMAIGIGKMIGFKFPENFNNPYISQSITEFWRRWHITLGNWMKNYLYIPLGGNRLSTNRTYLNLWIVFLLSGLWHGASWNFVIWGAYNGTFLVLERLFLLRIYERIGRFFRTLITFFIVAVGWVFFRVEKFGDAILYLKRMFSFHTGAQVKFGSEFCTFFAIAGFFAFFTFLKSGQKIQDAIYFDQYSNAKHIRMVFISAVLFTLSLSFITSTGFNPFIYYRF